MIEPALTIFAGLALIFFSRIYPDGRGTWDICGGVLLVSGAMNMGLAL